jgi:hypothetical protein
MTGVWALMPLFFFFLKYHVSAGCASRVFAAAPVPADWEDQETQHDLREGVRGRLPANIC